MINNSEQSRPPSSGNREEFKAVSEKLLQAFSLDNFELVEPPTKEGQPFVRITLPKSVTEGKNPFTEKIEHLRYAAEPSAALIARAASHLDQSIRDYASTHNLPEEDEIVIRNHPAIADVIERGFQYKGERTVLDEEYYQKEYEGGRRWMQIFFKNALSVAFHKIRPKIEDTPEFHAWMRNPIAQATRQRVDRIRQFLGDPSPRFIVVDSNSAEVFKAPQELIIKDVSG